MASEKKASLIIELVDKASAGLASVSSKVKGFTDVFFAGQAIIDGFQQTFGRAVDFLMSTLSSFDQSEAAVNKLNAALRRTGQYTPELSKHFQDFASEMQNASVHSDEEILATEALFTNFGMLGNQMTSATKAAANLSAGMGVDLHTSSMMLAKAFEGNVAGLARYGIKINDSIPPTERFAAVLAEVEKKFGGESSRQADTYSGKLTILRNKFDDLKEKIGRELMPVAEKFVGWMTAAIDKLNSLRQGNDEVSLAIKREQQAIADVISESTKRGEFSSKWVQDEIKAHQEEIASLRNLQKARAEADKPKGLDDKGTSDRAKEEQEAEDHAYRVKLLHLQGYHRKAELEQAKFEAKKLKASKEAQKAGSLVDQLAYKQKLEVTQEMFGNLASLQGSKHKELLLIGKAAAISDAVMRGVLAVQQAISNPPGPPFSLPLAASIGVMTAANVAKISGVQFAEGGMALPTSGGTFANIAEAGKAEAVIPLDDPRTKEKLADVMGGGLTVNINAGTVVADQYSVTQFAHMIGDELFRLGRNSKRVAL